MSNTKYVWPQPGEDGSLTVMTTSELFEQVELDREKFFQGLQHWRHDADNQTLTHLENNYEVDLERFPSKVEYLDWILHIHGKQWITKDALVELITALTYLIDAEDLPAVAS